MPIYMGIFEKPHVLDRKFRGEVKAKGYEGWIQLQSAQLGTNRNITTSTGRGTNREASAPAIQEVVITKLQDSVSTALYRETLGGEGKLIVSPSCRRASILTSVWRVNGKNLDANG